MDLRIANVTTIPMTARGTVKMVSHGRVPRVVLSLRASLTKIEATIGTITGKKPNNNPTAMMSRPRGSRGTGAGAAGTTGGGHGFSDITPP